MEWQLEETLEGTAITAVFQGDTVTGSAGCNIYTATFTLNGEQIAISDLTRAGMTCGEEVMVQEENYLAALVAAESYQIVGDRLEITSTVGSDEVILSFASAEP